MSGEDWKRVEDETPPLDRQFLGCRVGMKRHDGEPIRDMYFHICGRHIDYAGGPTQWTWNGADGMYGIRITHWQDLPPLPTIEPTT